VVCDVVRQLGKKSLGSVWMHKFGAAFTAVKWIDLAHEPAPASPGLAVASPYSQQEKLLMLLREVHALQKLNHPNIVRLLGVTMSDRMGQELWRALTKHSSASAQGASVRSSEHCFVGIVMEMCLHGSLQDIILRAAALFEATGLLGSGNAASEEDAMGRLLINSWATRVRVAREVAQALAACHDASILHRDLTTYNILMTAAAATQADAAPIAWRAADGAQQMGREWAVRLIDFGLSAPNPGRNPMLRSIAMHSPDWQAPECMESPFSLRGTHEPASDVYSYGIVLWSILTLSEPLSATKVRSCWR